VLGFHAAWRPGFLGFEIINDPPHARFGTSIRCQFNGGSAAMAGSALQQFICLAQSSCACTDNAADDCLQEWQNEPIVRSGNAMLTDQLICFGVLG
jgi:hypothetical protein